MAKIDLKSLTKTYPGGVTAVENASISIADGEFIVLVGPSGCGKSTLLRMVAGLETISSGEVLIGGEVVNKHEPGERDIAMVFQNYALYPHMSVYENMAYGLRNQRTPRSEIERRIQETAAILQLGDYLKRKPRQLSGGQRQRVAMGRAIVREPKAFLFDEPLSNLDAKLRVEMRGEIKQLQRRLGTTSIYVTHDQLEAMTLADRLVVLNKGRIEQIGAPLEVYRRPASTFVAGFIGSPAMNLLTAHSDGASLRIGETALPMDGRAVPAGDLLVGLRAEDAVPTASGATGDLSLSVSYVEDLGAERLVHGSLDGQRLAISVSPDFPVNERIEVTVDRTRLHLFDATSGARFS
ncbi:MAG: sn-glycerol-3-phosphate ABC transporter ATP-binding protein UgpC [Pseudomonadota bacterium]